VSLIVCCCGNSLPTRFICSESKTSDRDDEEDELEEEEEEKNGEEEGDDEDDEKDRGYNMVEEWE
jgi:hypothetical protein